MTIIQNSIFFLLLVTLFFTSCNGQTNTAQQNDNTTKQQSDTIEPPKTVKLQGKNKVANIGFGMQDRLGNIWLATNGDGVYYFDGTSFTNYREEDGLDNNIVYAILEDNSGNIWVGTTTGLNRFNPHKDSKNKKIFTQIPIHLSNTNNFPSTNFSNTNPPEQNGVWCMMEDKNGTIWLGTDDGVYCYNETNFTRFLDNKAMLNNDALQLKAIFSILQDTKGHIWFTACASEGVSRFDGKNLTNIIPYSNIGRTDRVIEDHKGNFWFAAVFKGVCRYDKNGFSGNVFNEKENGGPSNIVEDNEGNLWFDTQKGLGFYDGKTLKVLTEQDGLPTKNLIPLFKDGKGNIWFKAANMVLYSYDGKFTNYSE